MADKGGFTTEAFEELTKTKAEWQTEGNAQSAVGAWGGLSAVEGQSSIQSEKDVAFPQAQKDAFDEDGDRY